MRIISRALFYIFFIVAVLGFTCLVCIDDNGTSWIASAGIALGIIAAGVAGAWLTYDIYATVGTIIAIIFISEALIYRYILHGEGSFGKNEYKQICRYGFRKFTRCTVSAYKEYKGV